MVWKHWTRNPGAKILAFAMAGALWLSVTNQIEFERSLVFPVEYVNMPEGITPVQPLPTTAKARIRAKGKFLGYRLRTGVCRVDLADNQVGVNTLLLRGGNLVLPREVAVSRREILEPRRITVEFDETVRREIPITPAVAGAPAARFVQVGKTFVSPTVAMVQGPRKLVDEIATVVTEEIDISGHRSPVRKRVRLVAPGPETIEVTPSAAEIAITIEPLLTREIHGVALEVADDIREGWVPVFQPPEFTVEISGARSIVEAAANEVTSLPIRAKSWSLGTSDLRLEKLNGREIVFALREAFPLVIPAPALGTDGDPPAGPDSPPGRRIRPAVRGNVVGQLPLPGDVRILSVRPERFAVTIRKNGKVRKLVRAPEASP